MLRVRADIRDRCLVAVLLVDARELAAVARLDALLLDRPAAYLLRQQRALCFDALREIERGSPGARSIAMDTAALENFHL